LIDLLIKSLVSVSKMQ